ncbi:transmembrane protein 255B [Periophthalmus magnuspinnatus]|uniref:transmembrane protein 255B n=1 Tax=Periophthalmus magnuspinnatus TaxID=409849 RepID=UPI002436393E|nr:transmembrane protein 255B [Periophthalmus magnuspinnatus]
MSPPETPPTQPTPARAEEVEPVESDVVQYQRRGRTALWVTMTLLVLSLMVLTIGFLAATRTSNVSVAGFYSGITLSFGAFLGVVALHLVENRRPMLIASIIFISMGVIAAFLCAIVDGIIASQLIDVRPLEEDMCDYYGSVSGYAYDNYYTEVTCRASNKPCKLKLESHTCYCCYLFNCESDYHSQYYRFTGVRSCWDVIHLHRLLWASVVLNVVAMFLGIITAALLGAYKDLQKPSRNVPPSPAPPPHILYNPNQHILTYASFCPPQALPAYPNYPLPVPPNPSYPAPSTPQPVPEGGCPPNTVPCDPPQSQQPPSGQMPIAHPQGSTQETGGYPTPNAPNAPMLYGEAYGPFEKPPPYAY